MFPGIKVQIENEEFTIPSLSLGQLRNGILAKLKKHDELASGDNHFEMLLLRGEIILEALRRNYPDFSEEKLFNHLDLTTISAPWAAVLGLSGFLGDRETETKVEKIDGT